MPSTEFDEFYLVPKDHNPEWNVRWSGQNRARLTDPRVGLVHALTGSHGVEKFIDSPKEYATAVCDIAQAIWDEMLKRKIVALDPTLDELDAMAKEDFGVGLWRANDDKLGF